MEVKYHAIFRCALFFKILYNLPGQFLHLILFSKQVQWNSKLFPHSFLQCFFLFPGDHRPPAVNPPALISEIQRIQDCGNDPAFHSRFQKADRSSHILRLVVSVDTEYDCIRKRSHQEIILQRHPCQTAARSAPSRSVRSDIPFEADCASGSAGE